MQDPKISEMSHLEQVTRGVKRKYAQKPPGKMERLPITPEIFLKMRLVWEQKSHDFNKIMLWGVDMFIGTTENKHCPVMAMAYLPKRGQKEGMLF